jgi:putative membrane protein
MDGANQLAILEALGRAWGSLVLRPYVFGFVAVYLTVAAAAWGWRRAMAFTLWAGGVAFAAEWSSTRVGVPFGLYHYTGVTAGRELYLSNVPFFDPLSFTFLAYASLGLAGHLLGLGAAGRPTAARPEGPARDGGDGGSAGARLRLAALAGLLMMWLDVVIDPLAVRGEQWFLGRIFYYPEPGWYFGVPTANFVGWLVVGAAIAWGWGVLATLVGGVPPPWANRLPARPYHAVSLYYLILAFNLAVTAAVAEPALFWAGVLLHVPLAVVVVCFLRSREPTGRVPVGAGEPV